MKVKLKIIDTDEIYKTVDQLREAIGKLDVEDIDNANKELRKLQYDALMDEQDLPDEFNDYVITLEQLQKVFTKNKELQELMDKAIEQSKNVLMILDEDYE